MISFRPYSDADQTFLLKLNQESVNATGPLNAEKLSLLQTQGCQITIAVVDDAIVGFLMVFNDGSEYDSVNYQWFNKRFKRFSYIDRIVIDAASRGMGLGQQFYSNLKQQAERESQTWLVAEINVVPPNEPSLVFHQKQGFVEVGTQSSGSKTVSMQACELVG